MASNIVELFGYSPTDKSSAATAAKHDLYCPFLDAPCTKHFNDGEISGACTVQQVTAGPVICCPNRLYGDKYRILIDVAERAFGAGVRLISGDDVAKAEHDGRNVAVFGKRWGKELRLPKRVGTGAYFVDWILALIGPKGHLQEFVAVEVQTIDTTGNYRAEQATYMRDEVFSGRSTAGLNWENVSKRILPQIIYKGHVLRQERLCRGGLFFVCPTPVYDRIRARLGGVLLEYEMQPGSLTFMWYELGPAGANGTRRALLPGGSLTTTIDQVALAFTAPANLPPARVYEAAIQAELGAGRKT